MMIVDMAEAAERLARKGTPMKVDVAGVAEEIAENRARRAEKVRENRLRRIAQRQGLELHKSRTRDPRALDYGLYWLVDPSVPNVVCGRIPGDWHSESANLDDVERFLTEGGDAGTSA